MDERRQSVWDEALGIGVLRRWGAWRQDVVGRTPYPLLTNLAGVAFVLGAVALWFGFVGSNAGDAVLMVGAWIASGLLFVVAGAALVLRRRARRADAAVDDEPGTGVHIS